MKLKKKSKDSGKNKMDVLVLSPTPNRRICGFAFGYVQICLNYFAYQCLSQKRDGRKGSEAKRDSSVRWQKQQPVVVVDRPKFI